MQTGAYGNMKQETIRRQRYLSIQLQKSVHLIESKKANVLHTKLRTFKLNKFFLWRLGKLQSLQNTMSKNL